jgi:hypothetical protein
MGKTKLKDIIKNDTFPCIQDNEIDHIKNDCTIKYLRSLILIDMKAVHDKVMAARTAYNSNNYELEKSILEPFMSDEWCQSNYCGLYMYDMIYKYAEEVNYESPNLEEILLVQRDYVDYDHCDPNGYPYDAINKVFEIIDMIKEMDKDYIFAEASMRGALIEYINALFSDYNFTNDFCGYFYKKIIQDNILNNDQLVRIYPIAALKERLFDE